MRRNRVLIVEDSPTWAMLVAHWVRSLSYEVFCVETLAAAISHVKTNDDLLCVFLDLGLPDVLDYDAIPALVNADPHIPIVVLSGRDTVSLPTITAEGARMFLHKNRASPESIAQVLADIVS